MVRDREISSCVFKLHNLGITGGPRTGHAGTVGFLQVIPAVIIL